MRCEIARTIDAVPAEAWDELVANDAVTIQHWHLKACEKAKVSNLEPWYILGYKADRLAAVAYCFAIDLDLSKLGDGLTGDERGAIKNWRPDFMVFRVLEVGLVAGIGMAVQSRPDVEEEFVKELPAVLEEIAQTSNCSLILVRDVPKSETPLRRQLSEHGYSSLAGFPIAVMELPWDSFEDYLSALRSNRRNDVKTYLRKLRVPEIQVEYLDSFEQLAAELAELWRQVARRQTDYQHEELTEEYFRQMSNHPDGCCELIAVRRHDKLIGFGLAVIGADEYTGLYIGLEYSLRDEYALYFNLLYLFLRRAIELGKSRFNLGLASYEVKKRMGCDIHRVDYLVYHRDKPDLTWPVSRMLRAAITQPDDRGRVFISDPVKPKEISAEAQAASSDLFAKVDAYDRSGIARVMGMYTFFPTFETAQEPIIRHQGRDVIMLGTNSYLGLARHPTVVDAVHRAVDFFGTGCSGSPLLNGTLSLHDDLRRGVAELVHKQDAYLCSTGYQTNLATIAALAGDGDLIVSDERNHASIIDGAVLSRAKILRYRHRNLEDLERLLCESDGQRRLLVTDTLFSMEGTLVDLPNLVRLCKQHQVRMLVDESHALGVIGPDGAGVAAEAGLSDEVDLIMGTFSKSFASVGGFVAGNGKVIDFLRHTARGHVFSASLPPPAVAAALACLDVSRQEPWRRTNVRQNAEYFYKGLLALGYEVDYMGGAIVPLYCRSEAITFALFKKLFELGVFVNPVVWPGVPKGHELIRISFMPGHTREILDRALSIFAGLRSSYFPTPKPSFAAKDVAALMSDEMATQVNSGVA